MELELDLEVLLHPALRYTLEDLLQEELNREERGGVIPGSMSASDMRVGAVQPQVQLLSRQEHDGVATRDIKVSYRCQDTLPGASIRLHCVTELNGMLERQRSDSFRQALKSCGGPLCGESSPLPLTLLLHSFFVEASFVLVCRSTLDGQSLHRVYFREAPVVRFEVCSNVDDIAPAKSKIRKAMDRSVLQGLDAAMATYGCVRETTDLCSLCSLMDSSSSSPPSLPSSALGSSSLPHPLWEQLLPGPIDLTEVLEDVAPWDPSSSSPPPGPPPDPDPFF